MAKNKKNEKDKIQLPKVSVKSTNDLAMKTLKSGGVTQKDKENVKKVYGNKQSVPKDATMQGRGPVAATKQPTFSSEKELDSYIKSSVREDAKITPGAGVDYLKRMGARSRISEYDTASYEDLTRMSKTATGQERYKIDAARVRNANPQQRMELRKELQTQYDYYAPIYSDSKTMMDRYQSRKAAVTPEAYKATQTRMHQSKEGMDWYSALLGTVDDGIRAAADDKEYDSNLIKYGKIALDSGGKGEYIPTEYARQHPEALVDKYDIINSYHSGEKNKDSYLHEKITGGNYDMLTKNELKLYNTLHNDNPDIADEYLDSLGKTLRIRKAEEEQKVWSGFAEQNAFTGALASAVSVGQNLTSGIPAVIDNVLDKAVGGEVDTYDPYSRNLRNSQAIRQTLSENLGDTGGFVYNAGMSIVDNLANIAVFGGIGSGASKAITANLASSAAASGMISAADRGGNDWQVLLSGIANGTAEYLFEKFSIDNLLSSKNAIGWRNFIKTSLTQSGIEGSEELFTETANIITDALIMQGKSENAIKRREYVMQGMTAEEAARKVIHESVTQAALAGAAGMLSGGILGGGSGIIENASRENYMKRAGERLTQTPEKMNRVLQLGIENNNAEAKYTAELMTEGMKIDSKQAGKVLESVIAESIEKNGGFINIMRSIQAIEGRGAEYIGSEEAIETTKAVMEFVSGTATKAQSDIISRSEGAVTLLTAIEGHNTAWESVKKAAVRDLRRDTSTTLEMTSNGVRNNPSSVSEADTFSTGEKAFEGARYKIAYTTENEPVAVIEDDILDGVDKSEWAKTAKEAIKKFRPEIPISGRFVRVTKDTGREYTNSGYSKKLRSKDEVRYRDKLTAAGNLDEIVISSTRYVNEGLNHPRTDDIKDFARGHVLLQVGDRKYSAEVVIGLKMDETMVLYDIVNISDDVFEMKKETNPKPSTSENRAYSRQDSSPTNRLPQKEESVNTKSMRSSEVYSGGVKVTIPEGSRIVKNIVLDDESMKVRRRDEQAYKNVEMLAQDLGMRVKYVNNLTDGTGTALDGIITSQGIFINSEAKNPSHFAATHEFSHRMKQASSEQWQKYQDFVIKKLQSSGRYENIFNNKAAAYNNSNADYINEEIAADYIGELFDNEAELSEFIRESRRDAVTIRDVWYKILDKLGLSSEKEKAQRMWRDAYKAAMKSVEEGSAGEFTGEGKKSFAGVRAKTSNVDALNRAQKMEREGKTAEEIWQKTGWGRGLDGKWRFEINDFESYLTEKPNLELHRSEEGDYYAGKLEDIFNHKKLFESYPPLKETKIIIQEKEPGVYATTFTNRNEIVLSKTLFERTTDEYKDLLNNRQKYIDEIERTPEYKKYDSIYKMEDGEISLEEWLRLEAEARKNFFETDLGKRYYSLRWGKDNVRKYELGWSDKAKEVLLHEIQHLIQYEEGFAKGSNPSYWKGENNTNRDASDLYKNTAGEIEARDVQERRDMTEEERRNTYPESFRMNDNVVFADTEVNYDIVTLDNGKTYVEATRQIITGNNISQWRKSITEFFNNALKNGDIKIAATDGTILTITKDTAKKARDNYKIENGKIVKMSDGEFLVKLHAESHIDELAEIAKKTGHRKDGKNHSFAKNGFDYKTVYFKDFDNSYYEITLSVGLSNGISTVYNVGKIKTDNLPTGKIISRKVGQSPMANLSVDTTVSQNTPVVNTNSMQKVEKDARKSVSGARISEIEGETNTGFQKNSLVKKIQSKLAELSNEDVVLSLEANVFNDKNKNIVEQVGGFFDMLGNAVYRPGFGEVVLNKKGIKSSIGHKMGRAKCIAFRAVPDIIRYGKQIDYQAQWKGRPYDSYVFAGKVEIGGKEAYVGVVVTKSTNKNEYYLHEIVDGEGNFITIKNDEVTPNKTVSETDNSLHGGATSPIDNTISQDKDIVNNNDMQNAENDVREENENEPTPKGRIKPGAEPRRDVVVPGSMKKGTKVRQFARTAAEAETLSEETAEGVLENVEQGKFSYTPLSDKKAMNYAYSAIDTMGMEWAEDKVNGAITTHSLDKNTVALAEVLMQRYSEEGQQERVQELIINFAAESTRMGQSIQAISMLKKLDKNYEIAYIDKIVENLKEDIIRRNEKKKFGKEYSTDIEVSEELKKELLEAKTEAERVDIREKIYTEIAEQLPVTWIDRWNAWRYFAMLANLRTHVRNLLGNTFFMPMIGVKNIAAKFIEPIANSISGGKMERSKTFIVPKKYRQFAAADAKAMRDMLTSGGKHNPTGIIKGKQKMFIQPFEWMRIGNEKALEFEDWLFLKKHYATALRNYLAANKIDLDNMDEETLDRARYRAVQEAQRNTYRDMCAFANAASKFSRKNAATALLVEGLMPFKKTPVNVLKRGVEYSPAPLVKILFWDSFKVVKGNMTASEYIDELCCSLTGAGVVALGALFASLGWVKGASYDDKEKEFEELQGVQNYSLVIGEHSYTMDWLAPFSLPFFVGVELQIMLENGEGITFRELSKALSNITEPIFEMSMLQGISDAVSTINNAKSAETYGRALSNIAQSYFGQAVPTLFGQIARTVDDTQRKSYDDKNIDIPQGMQYFAQAQMKKIPGVSKTLEPYVDAWGREQTTDNAYLRAFSNMLSPGYYSKVKSSEMEAELKRLHSVVGEEINVFPSAAVKSFNLNNGKEKNLTAKEYTNMQAVQGQTAYRMLKDITKTAAYKKHNDGIKGKIVEKVYELSKANAKKGIAGNKWTGSNWIENTLAVLREKGISAAEKSILTLADDWAYEESREGYKDDFAYNKSEFSAAELGVIEKVESDYATYYASVERGREYNEKTLRHIDVYDEKLSEEMPIEEYAAVRAYAKKTAAMADGKESMKKNELKAYLDSTDYSLAVKRALFEAIGNSNWNNPY